MQGKTLDQLLEEQKHDRVAEVVKKIDEVTVGHTAREVVIACNERILSVCRQENCPDSFKMQVIRYLTMDILELLTDPKALAKQKAAAEGLIQTLNGMKQ